MESDARIESAAHGPLVLNQPSQRGVVWIGRVLLKSKRRGDEIDAHPQRLAQRQHHIVDRQFPQVGPPCVGGKRLPAHRLILVVTPFHLFHRGPHVRQEFRERVVFHREARGRHARAHAIDQARGHMVSYPRHGVGRHVRLRQLRRQIERDVAGQQTPAHERILARIKLAANRLMVGVETPRDAPQMKSGLQFGEHAAMAHSFNALTLVPLGHAGADEWKRHGVEPAFEHCVDVVYQLARNAVLVRGDAQVDSAHRPFHRGPMQRRKSRANAQRAPAEVRGGCRENRRRRIELLHEILQAKQVFPTGREGRRAFVSGNAIGKDIRRSIDFRGVKAPRAVSRLLVLDHRPGTGCGFERARRPLLQKSAVVERPAQRRPIQAEIRADARIAGDAEIVIEEKLIDASHQMVMAWNPPSTMSSSPVMNDPALSLASRRVAPMSSRASPNRAMGVCPMMLATRSGLRMLRFCSAGKKPGTSTFTRTR